MKKKNRKKIQSDLEGVYQPGVFSSNFVTTLWSDLGESFPLLGLESCLTSHPLQPCVYVTHLLWFPIGFGQSPSVLSIVFQIFHDLAQLLANSLPFFYPTRAWFTHLLIAAQRQQFLRRAMHTTLTVGILTTLKDIPDGDTLREGILFWLKVSKVSIYHGGEDMI